MTRYSKVIEKDAETNLVQSVRQLKGMCIKLKFIGLLGAPDRLVLLPGGRFYFVELKQPTGKLETSQEVLFPKLARLGFKVHELYGEPDVLSFINSITKEFHHE